MPFTVAHAAAALPLRRLNLVWSAFLVGSMAPDLPYVIGSVEYRALGHNFPGVVMFTLPMSFVLLWLFHCAIKKPVAGLLPISMQQRLGNQLGEFRFGGARRILAVAWSIILGIATHLLWDSFTHAYTWPWEHLVWLQSWFKFPVVGWMATYGLLQYASTLLGLLAMVGWVFLWYRNTAPHISTTSGPRIRSRFSLAVIMFAIAVAAGIVRAAMLASASTGDLILDLYALQFGVTALAVAFWELLVYGLIVTSLGYSSRRLSSV
jgi:Domain of unknown function (DUF4184)